MLSKPTCKPWNSSLLLKNIPVNFLDIFFLKSDFLCKMAPDVSISDVLSSLTLIEEEDVTVKPENLLTHRGVLLKKEIQRAARKYFTDDAWLVIESTLKELTSKKAFYFSNCWRYLITDLIPPANIW